MITDKDFNKDYDKYYHSFNGNHNGYWEIDYTEIKKKDCKGIYSISLDDFSSFSYFRTLTEHQKIKDFSLQHSLKTNVIYIGDSESGVRERLFYHELGGDYLQGVNPKEKRATFYRKLGSVLGFNSIEKKKNFIFSKSVNTQILKWIKKHLKVKFYDVEREGCFEKYDYEKLKPYVRSIQDNLISTFKPVFNGNNLGKDKKGKKISKCEEISYLHGLNKK